MIKFGLAESAKMCGVYSTAFSPAGSALQAFAARISTAEAKSSRAPGAQLVVWCSSPIGSALVRGSDYPGATSDSGTLSFLSWPSHHMRYCLT